MTSILTFCSMSYAQLIFFFFAFTGLIVIIAYSMMGRTLCARKPPFDCDSIEGSASSQQVILNFFLREKTMLRIRYRRRNIGTMIHLSLNIIIFSRYSSQKFLFNIKNFIAGKYRFSNCFYNVHYRSFSHTLVWNFV